MRSLVAATNMPLLTAIGTSLVSVTAFGLTTASNYALSGLIDAVRRRGMDIYLVRVMRPARIVLERTGVIASLGPEHIWHNIAQAVKQAKRVARLGVGEAEEPAIEIDHEHIAADADTGTDDADEPGGPIYPRDRVDRG